MHDRQRERLAELLRALPAPPAACVRAAKALPSTKGAPAPSGAFSAAGEIHELGLRLDGDPTLLSRLEQSPVEALQDAGFIDLAVQVRLVREKAPELGARLEGDDVFRNQVEDDPVDALTTAGLPGMAVEWFLRALGAPAAVLDKVSPEVVAHAAHPRLLSLLLPQRLTQRWPDKGP